MLPPVINIGHGVVGIVGSIVPVFAVPPSQVLPGKVTTSQLHKPSRELSMTNRLISTT